MISREKNPAAMAALDTLKRIDHGALAPTIIVQPKPGAYGNIFFYPQNECASTLAGIAGNKTLTRSTLRSAERMGLKLATVHMGQTIPTTYEALAKEYPEPSLSREILS